ncbi:uncharacterized protein LOC104892705 [Beta vulgaris subsp. vulgaris]|uniref:uncharacterized protein LOC104892705 n=1 Tax=Beta vulgaris subsp. vulgaris TaxID=3555 RepID=UPI00054006F7|nr:uncharacterized protein LOC104892705 [Beta vulgaris subsp. vulgaris]
MKPLLPFLIYDYQNAFVQGRHMDDNILISHKLTHIINKQRSGNRYLAALKLDMNKAYDRVNWQFIVKVLSAYGFPRYWIMLIKQCIETVSYRVMINGTATPTFLPHCGLRQGDPLSPYLFLFCMDILSRMTTRATVTRQLQGIKIGKQGPTVSHLFFADDALFFFRATPAICATLNTIITRFCSVSGQMINHTKSFVKFSPNIPPDQRQVYKNSLQLDDKPSLGTYLGSSIDIQGSKVPHFTFLLDIVSRKIEIWNHTWLSQPMKLVIINSILVATIMHHLSIFQIPTTITNKLDAMLARFFWKNNSQTGLHWKKKEILHHPRGQGGLGIRSIGTFNTALLMKQVWRIHNKPHLLLSKVFKPSNPQTSWIRSTKSKISLGRRGLLSASQSLRKNCVWKVGNGTSIRAGLQPWVFGNIPTFRDGITLREAAQTRVADLILPHNQGWNIRKLYTLFIPSDAHLIQRIELPARFDVPDRVYWPLARSGEYTTKSGYGLLLQQQQQQQTHSMTLPENSKFFHHLWGLNIMPKWKIFIWKLWHNCLATSSNLQRRGIINTTHCSMCLDDNEDDQHIFRFCPMAMEAWEGSPLSISSSENHAMSLASWIVFWLEKYLKEDGYRGLRVPIFIGTLWAIWKTRNEQIFRQGRTMLDAYNSNISESRQLHKRYIVDDVLIGDPPPAPNLIHPPGFIFTDLRHGQMGVPDLIIRIDGSWDHFNGHGGFAWVAHCHRHHIRSHGSFMQASSTLHTESMACLSALRWITTTSFSRILLLTYSEQLVRNLVPNTPADISISHTLSGIIEASTGLHSCRIIKVSRGQVQQAHEIAHHCRLHRVNVG